MLQPLPLIWQSLCSSWQWPMPRERSLKAMSHEVNADVVHRWRRQAGRSDAPALVNMRDFVPVSLASTSAPAEIRMELRRGATSMTIAWPAAAAADCAAWMRELLR